jgi:hypothetical protein
LSHLTSFPCNFTLFLFFPTLAQLKITIGVYPRRSYNKTGMSDSFKRAVISLGSIMLCAGASAIVNDSANPYQGIVERNVFGLKPLPPISKVDEKPASAPPPITLTGMTSILSSKRALLNVQLPGKPIQSFILAEGQREGDIELLEIDEKAGSVKLNYGGTTVPLNFEKNGPKLTASSPGTALPGTPGAAAPMATQFASANVNNAANGLKPIQTRNWIPQAANQPAANNGANVNGANFNGANVNPSYNGGVPSPGFSSVPISGSNQAQTPPTPTAVDPDVQAMQMLAQHVQASDAGHQMPPLPPPLAEAIGENTSSGPPVPQQQQPTPNRQNPFPQRPPGLPPLPQ